jgi:hypothetical protein
MSINAKEKLELKKGGFPNLTQPMDEVIYQEAIDSCMAWLETEKEFENDDVIVGSYINKMKTVIKLILEGNRSIVPRLQDVMISRIGRDHNGNLNQLQNISENAVLALFTNNMEKILEDFAGVTAFEKAKYRSYLPLSQQ